MARISKHTKSLMLAELLKHGKFDENISAKEQTMREIGDEIHHSIFGKYLPAINKLPDTMFNYTQQLTLDGIESPDSKFRLRVSLSDFRVATARGGNLTEDFHKLTNDSDLIKRYLAARKDFEDEQVKKRAAKEEADAVLSSVTTFNKLWEVWSDARPILEKFDTTTPNLPTVVSQVATLNTIFGLPPQEQK